MAHLIEVSGILQANPTILNTDSGEQINVPKTTGHSSAALTAEALAEIGRSGRAVRDAPNRGSFDLPGGDGCGLVSKRFFVCETIAS